MENIISRIEEIPARKIALLALSFWLISLLLPTFITYEPENEVVYGVTVLMMGWTAIIVSYLPWFANIFFIYAILKVSSSKSSAHISTIITFILSLDFIRFTLTYDRFDMYATTIYGYGYGVLFWLLSICTLMIASGVYNIQRGIGEYNGETVKREGLSLHTLGMLYAVLIIISFIYFGITDRVSPNKEEAKNLTSNVMFKMGDVCNVENAPPDNVIEVNGTLEVMGGFGRLPLGFNKAEDFLDMGIEKVRAGEYDYFYETLNGTKKVVFKKAEGKISAIFKFRELPGKGGKVSAALYSVDKNKVAFDRVWKEDRLSYRRGYCPRYQGFYREKYLQRKLFKSAIKIIKTEKTVKTNPVQVETRKATEPKTLKSLIGIESKTNTKNYKRKMTYNCPNGVYLEIKKGINNRRNQAVFKINDSYYSGDLYAGAICKENAVYFLSTPLRTGSHFKIRLNKHSLIDFSKIYSTEVLFTKSEGQKYRRFHVGYRNISIKNDMLILELLPEREKYNAIVKVELPEN